MRALTRGRHHVRVNFGNLLKRTGVAGAEMMILGGGGEVRLPLKVLDGGRVSTFG